MAMNQRYTHFDHIALTVPDGVKSGQPVRVGAIAGVAQIDRQPDGKATVWLDGSHMIDVAGALTEGQVVYIKADRTLTALGDAVGLSASAVQRRIKRYRETGLLRQVAVLDADAFPAVVLAAVWVTMERESVRQLNAFYARMRAAPEVQQCYQIAGEWDYLVIMATTSVAGAAMIEAASRCFA